MDTVLGLDYIQMVFSYAEMGLCINIYCYLKFILFLFKMFLFFKLQKGRIKSKKVHFLIIKLFQLE